MAEVQLIPKLPEFADILRFLKSRWPNHPDMPMTRRDESIIELIAAAVDQSNFAVQKLLDGGPAHYVGYQTPFGKVTVTAPSEEALGWFMRKVDER